MMFASLANASPLFKPAFNAARCGVKAGTLKLVLQVMTQAGYKCHRDKCCFGFPSVIFLGHVGSGNGLAVYPAKDKVINDWKPPENVGNVRSFAGLVQYLKRFVKDVNTGVPQ